LIAEEAGYVFTVEQDAVFPLARNKLDSGFSRKLFQRSVLVQADLCPESLKSEGAVHCACLEVEQAKVASEMPGEGTLPSSRRSVNGDD
jgi:hypothetical protein